MKLRLMIVISAVAMLTACATVPSTSIEALEGEIPEGNGLVVAESLNNTTRIVSRIVNWTEIVLWRQDYEGEDDTFSIGALRTSHSTQVYMGTIPAGTYRIGMLFAYLHDGNAGYSARALAMPAMGTFEVKAGHVTNLGAILYQPFQSRSWVEDEYPDYAMTRIPHDDLWPVLSHLHPKFSAMIDRDLPVLGWNPDNYDKERTAVARLMKEAALPTNLHTLSDGSFVLSGFLGGLYRLSDTEISNYSLDIHYRITDLVELPDGQLLIGNEFGKLILSRSLGGTYRVINIDQGMQHVIDIDLSDGGQAYVMTIADADYRLYRYVADTESLSLIKTLPKGSKGMFGISHPVLIGTTNGAAMYMDKVMYRYDEIVDQWTETKADEFRQLYRQPDGYVSGIPHSSWSGTKAAQFSADDGVTWVPLQEKVSIFGSSQAPTYRLENGEYIRTGEGVDIKFIGDSMVKDQVPVLSTFDNGVNWTQISTVPRGCTTIAVEVSTDEFLHVLCSDGGTVSSTDRGRTWSRSSLSRIPEFEAFPEQLKLRYARD